jgi:hypothetical protein
MMTGCEVVRRAINFSGPDRLPFDMHVSGPSDVYHVGLEKLMGEKKKFPSYTVNVDHFGCQFKILNEKTMGQPANFPLPNIRKLDEFVFPDPKDDYLYSYIEKNIGDAHESYVSTYSIWFTFFERMHFIHGFENTMADLFLQRPLMAEFAEKIIEYNISVIKELARRFPGKIHGIAMSDDWGTQTSTLIDIKLFRKFFLPRYKRLFGVIRDHGMDVWLHSCGYVISFIPDFIDAGVQVLNLQQPRIFDLEELGKFAGSVCFSVPIDIQNTMPSGSIQDIRLEARELVEHLATPKGGLIASEHPDYEGNGIEPIKGKWAYDAFLAADPFRYRS